MFFYVFFFKQKTAYEMRISDWSSDVCSSDLLTANRVSPADRILDLGVQGIRHAHVRTLPPLPEMRRSRRRNSKNHGERNRDSSRRTFTTSSRLSGAVTSANSSSSSTNRVAISRGDPW